MVVRNKKGFTLAELLVIVAIIAVLVAISIPIFTGQLERSREATDLANLRAAYAEVVTAGISNDTSGNNGVSYAGDQWFKTIEIVQKENGWQYFDKDETLVGGMSLRNAHNDVSAGQTAQVYYKEDGTSYIWFQCPDDPDGRGCNYD